jgi:hypothetical protein
MLRPTVNAPSEFVTVWVATRVSVFVTTTVAPGTTPPTESTTVPVSEVFVLPACAYACWLARHARQEANAITSERLRVCMVSILRNEAIAGGRRSVGTAIGRLQAAQYAVKKEKVVNP